MPCEVRHFALVRVVRGLQNFTLHFANSLSPQNIYVCIYNVEICFYTYGDLFATLIVLYVI